MSENVTDIEIVNRKFENLDSELNTFLQSIREIKEIRENVGGLPDKLTQHEAEIEEKKIKLGQLEASISKLLKIFEEKSKGAIVDLEKKADDMAAEVKSALSRFDEISKQAGNQFQEKDRERLETVSKKHEELNIYCKSSKKIIDAHEQAIATLKNGYMTVSGMFEKLETSHNEMKNKLLALQRWPNQIETRTIEMEERLTALVDEKHSNQKAFMWMLLITLIASIAFSFSVFYLQQ